MMDWSDVQVFLAVARTGGLGAAGRELGQSQPTMGRRVRALEDALGQTLFQRTAEGFVLTAEGEAILPHAERLEEEALAIQRTLDGGRDLSGLLRVACSDWFGVHILSPVVARFGALHPSVTVELLTDARPYSLARREADLAFRIRPFDEPDAIVRKLLHMPYGLYQAAGAPHPGDGEGVRLITMDTAFDGLPDVTWLRKALPKAAIGARSNNRDVQAKLCQLGAGLAVLPRPLGDSLSGLERIDLGEGPPGRDTWLGYHRDLRRNARLRAFLDVALDQLAN